MKGRTHYEESNQTVIEWDGDRTGHEVITIVEDIAYAVRVSSLTPTIADVIGGTVVLHDNNNPGEYLEEILTEDNVLPGDYGCFMVGSTVIVVTDAPITIGGIAINSNGVYFMDSLDGTVKSLTYGSTVVHKLDPKFLPKGGVGYVDDDLVIISSDIDMDNADIAYVDNEPMLYKISDVELDYTDLFGGMIDATSGEESLSAEINENNTEVVFLSDDCTVIVAADLIPLYIVNVDNCTVDNTITFPKRGIYTLAELITSAKFKITYGSSIIHKIDDKFIPDSVARKVDVTWENLPDKPFGENQTVIEWDGGTEGRDSFGFENGTVFYKVSDATPSAEELTGRELVIVIDGEPMTIVLDENTLFTGDGYVQITELGFVVTQTPFIYDDITAEAPTTGIYWLSYGDAFSASLTYGSIKTIEEKFIPDSIARKDDIPESIGGVSSWDELLDKPDTLPNPKGLIFTGAANAYYDGSEEVSIEIPMQKNITVNGISPDENGNIEIEAGFEKNQADWNQNDETAVDFVKNRTHWKEETVEVLFSEDNIDFSETVSRPETFQLEAEAYNIVIDGEDHYYDLATYNGNNYIGDRYGDPIIVTVQGGNLLMEMEDGGVHSIKIFAISRNYHFNDWFVKEIQGDWQESDSNSPAYVKNKPFYQFVNENGVIFSGAYDVEILDGLYSIQDITVDRIPILGEYYRVNISGPATQYRYKLKEYQNAVCYLGNLSIANSGLENTGEKFLIVFSSDKSSLSIYSNSIINAAEPYSNNASVIGPCIDYHTIDEKYLPDTIARKSDVLIQSDWNQNMIGQPDHIQNRTHWLESGVSVLAEQPNALTFTDVTEGGYTPPEGYIWCNDFPKFANNLSAGQKYVIIWNGKQYELTCEYKDWKELYKDSDGRIHTIVNGYTKFIGNTDLCTIGGVYMSYSDQELVSIEYNSPLVNSHPDVPFIIYQGVYDTKGVTNLANQSLYGMYIQESEPRSAELEMYEDVHLYHTLDERYIPDTIARKADIPNDEHINNLINTALGVIENGTY